MKNSTERTFATMLENIKSNPGIRSSELNRRLNRVEPDSRRAALVRRGLVRKVNERGATHLYAT